MHGILARGLCINDKGAFSLSPSFRCGSLGLFLVTELDQLLGYTVRMNPASPRHRGRRTRRRSNSLVTAS